MKNGDISNERGYCIGIRCEDFFFEYKDDNIIDKALNLIQGKTHRAVINKEVRSLMNYIYWNTEMTILLIIDDENYTKDFKNSVDDLPFNQVGQVFTSIAEVTMMLNVGDLTYYVDNDIIRRQSVNSKYAVSLEQMNTIIKRKVKRPDEKS